MRYSTEAIPIVLYKINNILFTITTLLNITSYSIDDKIW